MGEKERGEREGKQKQFNGKEKIGRKKRRVKWIERETEDIKRRESKENSHTYDT